MTTQPFVTMLTKNAEGSYDYAPISTTFMAELVKLIISSCLYFRTARHTHDALRAKEVLQFSVPAFVYFVNNNLIFIILMYVNSTTYQILSSLKTVATGILFRVILKRKLADVQKSAILLLACGAAVSQFPVCSSVTCPEPLDLSKLIAESSATGNATAILEQALVMAAEQARLNAVAESANDFIKPGAGGGGAIIGVLVALLACLNSAFAGVYSELLLKKDGSLHSIHLQNMLLYTWGVLFNIIAVFVINSKLVRGLFRFSVAPCHQQRAQWPGDLRYPQICGQHRARICAHGGHAAHDGPRAAVHGCTVLPAAPCLDHHRHELNLSLQLKAAASEGGSAAHEGTGV